MKITIYSIPDCQFCKQEKEYLTSKGLQFEDKDVQNDRDALAEMLQISNNFAGVPFTVIEKDSGEKVMLKGFTQSEFEEALAGAQATAAGLVGTDQAGISAPMSASATMSDPMAVAAPMSAPATAPMSAPAAPADPATPALGALDAQDVMGGSMSSPTTPQTDSILPGAAVSDPISVPSSKSTDSSSEPQDTLNDLLSGMKNDTDGSGMPPMGDTANFGSSLGSGQPTAPTTPTDPSQQASSTWNTQPLTPPAMPSTMSDMPSTMSDSPSPFGSAPSSPSAPGLGSAPSAPSIPSLGTTPPAPAAPSIPSSPSFGSPSSPSMPGIPPAPTAPSIPSAPAGGLPDLPDFSKAN